MATISQNKERERAAYRIYKVKKLNMAPFKDLNYYEYLPGIVTLLSL